MFKRIFILFVLIGIGFMAAEKPTEAKDNKTTVIVDTGLRKCYDNRKEIPFPRRGKAFFGQDAQYEGNTPAYRNNGDGTITDLNTRLMWSKAVDKKKVS